MALFGGPQQGMKSTLRAFGGALFSGEPFEVSRWRLRRTRPGMYFESPLSKTGSCSLK
jgi:hypothetical protein